MITADLTGIGEYIGTVGGILDAIEDPRFEGDFTEHLMDRINAVFMAESIAVNESGVQRLQHVFEWGPQDESGVATGEPGSIPLFKLTRSGGAGTYQMGYTFLPSAKAVPLPNPEVYGFKPEKLAYLRRHVFQLKALVMETRSRVSIAPVGAKKLFIPSETSTKGYTMTTGPVAINPGGENATGGFAKWWIEWFELRAPEVVSEETQRTEDWLVLTGRKYVRYAAGTIIGGEKVGGRFATGRGVSVSYVNAKAADIKRKVLSESKRHFDEDAWSATWDE